MTALHSYDRLESLGLWRATPSDQRREAVVQLGKASLTISNIAGQPLAHWSLAAVERVALSNRDGVVYRSHPDASDTLELDDPAMIAALDQIQQAVHVRTRPPRKWGRWAALAMLALGVGVAQGYASRNLPSYAAEILPDARAAEMANRLVDQLEYLAGPRCTTPESNQAIQLLQDRFADLGPVTFVVLPLGQNHAIALPGDQIILPLGLLDETTSADALAGHIILAKSAAILADPTERLFRHAGLWATLNYLLRNAISDGAIQSVAENILTQKAATAAAPTLLQGFDVLDISATPFAKTAYAAQAGVSEALLAQDPNPAGTKNPILPDGAWLGLISACNG